MNSFTDLYGDRPIATLGEAMLPVLKVVRVKEDHTLLGLDIQAYYAVYMLDTRAKPQWLRRTDLPGVQYDVAAIALCHFVEFKGDLDFHPDREAIQDLENSVPTDQFNSPEHRIDLEVYQAIPESDIKDFDPGWEWLKSAGFQTVRQYIDAAVEQETANPTWS